MNKRFLLPPLWSLEMQWEKGCPVTSFLGDWAQGIRQKEQGGGVEDSPV